MLHARTTCSYSLKIFSTKAIHWNPTERPMSPSTRQAVATKARRQSTARHHLKLHGKASNRNYISTSTQLACQTLTPHFTVRNRFQSQRKHIVHAIVLCAARTVTPKLLQTKNTDKKQHLPQTTCVSLKSIRTVATQRGRSKRRLLGEWCATPLQTITNSRILHAQTFRHCDACSL